MPSRRYSGMTAQPIPSLAQASSSRAAVPSPRAPKRKSWPAAQPVRLLAAPGQELAMAQMDAVKEAQSNDAWLVQISSPRKSF